MKRITQAALQKIMNKYPGLVQSLEYTSPMDAAEEYDLSYFYVTQVKKAAIAYDIIGAYDSGDSPDPWDLAEQE